MRMPVGTTVAAAAGRLTEEAFVDRFGALPEMAIPRQA